jgi:hypothetical protein
LPLKSCSHLIFGGASALLSANKMGKLISNTTFSIEKMSPRFIMINCFWYLTISLTPEKRKRQIVTLVQVVV